METPLAYPETIGRENTDETIQKRLAMRNLMDELRSTGMLSGGPTPLSKSDRQAFVNQLDRLISNRIRG